MEGVPHVIAKLVHESGPVEAAVPPDLELRLRLYHLCTHLLGGAVERVASTYQAEELLHEQRCLYTLRVAR